MVQTHPLSPLAEHRNRPPSGSGSSGAVAGTALQLPAMPRPLRVSSEPLLTALQRHQEQRTLSALLQQQRSYAATQQQQPQHPNSAATLSRLAHVLLRNPALASQLAETLAAMLMYNQGFLAGMGAWDPIQAAGPPAAAGQPSPFAAAALQNGAPQGSGSSGGQEQRREAPAAQRSGSGSLGLEATGGGGDEAPPAAKRMRREDGATPPPQRPSAELAARQPSETGGWELQHTTAMPKLPGTPRSAAVLRLPSGLDGGAGPGSGPAARCTPPGGPQLAPAADVHDCIALLHAYAAAKAEQRRGALTQALLASVGPGSTPSTASAGNSA